MLDEGPVSDTTFTFPSTDNCSLKLWQVQGPVSDTTFTFPSTDNCSLKLWQVQIGFPKAHSRRSKS
ncbi:hypothetical protein C0J52_14414 [Blattella germanica]|nr:hypothetical protein C0J52_14414 [Blattella germanica]